MVGKTLLFLPLVGFGMGVSLQAGYLTFEKSSAHKEAYLKTLEITYKGEVVYRLLLNEVHFKNRPAVGDFDQSQIDASLGFKLERNFLWRVGFHYLPYAKPRISDNAYGFLTSLTYRGGEKSFSLRLFQNNLREGLSTLQISPSVGWRIGRFTLFGGMDLHLYNRRKTQSVELPRRELLSANLGFKFPFGGNSFFSTSLWFGRRVFSYRGGLLENHPQEQRHGFKVSYGRKIHRKVSANFSFLFKGYKELRTGRKAKVYGFLFSLGF